MQTKIDLKKLRLRPYKKCDAKFIVKWSKDEVAFRKWCSDRWQSYPITAEDMNRKYYDNNGDCIDEDNFYPITLIDNSTVAGHLILRFTNSLYHIFEATSLFIGSHHFNTHIKYRKCYLLT